MTRHLLVIGAQRCGTTWLAQLLDAHPQVTMARPNRPEPKVFLSEELVSRGRDWYVQTYFAHTTDELLLGDKSTSYLEYPEVADRAVSVLGDPLVLVQLRDPVSRAISHWAFSSDSGLENRRLDEALAANLDGPLPWDPESTSVSPYAYLERGRYIDYLRPWYERFGDDLSVTFLEELGTGLDSVRDLYATLGVARDPLPTVARQPVNQSSQDKPDLSPDLHARLREYFDDSDRALASLLGRRLPWGDLTTERSRG